MSHSVYSFQPRHALRKIILAGLITCAVLLFESACGVSTIREADSAEGTPLAETEPLPAIPITSENGIPTAGITPSPASSPTPHVAEPTQTVTIDLATLPAQPFEPTEPVSVTVETVTPSSSPLSAQPKAPLAAVNLVNPGPQSRLLSPIYMEASVIPVDRGVVRIELLGEDGRVLYREVQQFKETGGKRYYLNLSVEFEIPSVAEAAQLNVSVEDPEGRPVALNSVDVVLLSMGASEVFSGEDLHEPVVFEQPRVNQFIQGSTLQVSGYARPVNTQPLVLEVIDAKGNVIGSRQIPVEANQVDVYVPFETEITCTPQRESWTRLILRQSGTRIPGTAMLSSVLFYLSP
ncbi:MAG TPA: hypothetical protein VHO48_02275 [Anaerolineaceae bacterium]|nr:hypothetical protein [Anaerolineaceae bacterium]